MTICCLYVDVVYINMYILAEKPTNDSALAKMSRRRPGDASVTNVNVSYIGKFLQENIFTKSKKFAQTVIFAEIFSHFVK